MTLVDGIKKAIELFDIDILKSARIVSILNDFGVFKGEPAIRNVLLSLINYHVICDCITTDDNKTEIAISKVVYLTGLQKEIVARTINEIRKAIPLEEQKNETSTLEQEIRCICHDGKWGYVNQNNEIIVPLKYTGISVITPTGVYAAASKMRKFYDTIDNDIYWDGCRTDIMGTIKDVSSPLSLMLGDKPVPKGAGRHYTYTERQPIYIRPIYDNREIPKPKEIHAVTQYAEVPDGWQLYDNQHRPISKEYSNIFLCETTLSSLKDVVLPLKAHPMFFTASRFQAKGLLLVKKGYRRGIIDFKGKEIIPPYWTKFELCANSIIAYSRGSVKIYPHWSEYDFNGNCLYSISEEWLHFDEIELKSGGLVYVNKASLKGIVNCQGKVLIPIDNFQISHIQERREYFSCFITIKNHRVTIYDETFNVLYDIFTEQQLKAGHIPTFWGSALLCPHLPLNFIIQTESKNKRNREYMCMVIDKKGKAIIPLTKGRLVSYEIDGYTLMNEGSKYKYDFNGNLINHGNT